MFKKILVCLDGSPLAEEILPLVEAQAVGFKSSVILLQVLRSPSQVVPATALEAGMMVSPTDSGMNLTTRIAEEAQAEALAYLETKAEALRSKGIKVECAVQEGRAGQVILDYAAKSCASLIALATHGRSGLGRAVYGSVADHILKNSGLPMLVIKPEPVG